ncbi:MAG TPA: thiamine pyrophosphate-dependent enzyme, partial [Roseomonas sp.]
HPLFAGHLHAAPQQVSETLIGHDLVLVIGAPVFTFHVAGECGLFRSGIPIVQMTTDAEAASSAPAGMAMLGALRLGIPALAALLPANARPLPAPRPRQAPPAASTPLAAPYALHRLHAAMPDDAILVEEAPSHRPAMHAQMPIREWGAFFTMASGGLGYSLPAAVGVALGSPGRRVVCLIGDGSFMYSPQALWTAVQEKLPLAVIVMNNAGYGAMRSFSRVLQVRDAPGIDLPGIDFVSIARGMGCPARAVATPGELDAALAEAMAADGPMLVEVAVDGAIATLYDKT